MTAAIFLFAERGYDATTVPMIADNAKVGAGTIYRYFENKEALVNALFQKCIHKFLEAFKSTKLESTTDVRQQFHVLFHVMVDYAKNNTHELHFIDTHCGGHYLDDNSKQIFHDFLNFLKNFIEHGKEQGVLCLLPSDALIAIVYGAFSHLFKLIRVGVIQESTELLDSIEECCWNAIRIH
ncbi:TetR family transcriptional regulator [Paenibacillus macquariensis subsp. defensor]|nr:TetR family transcriptional regulator [Paenibacillus macquariensis subsp. defensor]